MKKYLIAAVLLTAGFQAMAAERIISTAGNVSEILVKLGKSEQIAGVDTTSLLPADVMKDKEKIGYRRQLSAEGILSLNPDLIILAPDSGPAAVIEQIKSTNIPLLNIKDSQTLEGIRQDITAIGKAVAAEEAAAALNAQIEKDEAALAETLQQNGKGSALVIMDAGSHGSFALGHHTQGENLLKILHLDNAFDIDGRKPIAAEVLAASPADVILIAGRSNAAAAPVIEKIDLTAEPQFAQTAAGQKGCVFNVNILAALGFGWNTAINAKTIAEAIHPCLTK